ncbi:MAG: CooT family nickel-binding protein [Thermoplasmata archaeon]|nr:CooT family nickel-binding protein [Thermoplasmata archaeon]
MCESAVFVMSDGERTLVMQEAARMMVTDEGVWVFDTLGSSKLVRNAEISEANLIRHEVVLKLREV